MVDADSCSRVVPPTHHYTLGDRSSIGFTDILSIVPTLAMSHSRSNLKTSTASLASTPRATTILVPTTCRCDGYEHQAPTGQQMTATIITAEDATRASDQNTTTQTHPPLTRYVEDIANALTILQHRLVTESPHKSSPAFRFLNKDGQEVMTFRPDCDLRAMSQYDGGRRGRHFERLPNSPLTVLESMALYPQWCIRMLDSHSVVAGTMVHDMFTPSDWQAFKIGGVKSDRLTAYQAWRNGFLTSVGFGEI